MRIGIQENKLVAHKRSFNDMEAAYFDKPDLGLGHIDGFFSVRETEYTFVLSGSRAALFDVLYKLSVVFDVELI